MRDILSTLEQWVASGETAAVATVVRTERSSPREPGSAMAMSSAGDIAGSVTGGCVEPAVCLHGEEVIAGGPPRLAAYGIADEDAFEVGLPCGGNIDIFIDAMDPAIVAAVADAVREDRSLAVVTTIAGPGLGTRRLVDLTEPPGPVRDLLERGISDLVDDGEDELFVSTFAPRPAMYVFGAMDHATALARLGRFLGYRVTVCDARGAFVTAERFPDADELVVGWPHEFLATAPIDRRTVICVLTHEERFDVPALKVALASAAGYIGAMGSRRTIARRNERLAADGVSDGDIARIHAPIGYKIGSRTPEEVAVSIGAQIISVLRQPQGVTA